ncbi:hypothetical protein WOLCODRAFT_139519 [Wolfiporia cocos MD-104 SS10]|uniref:Transcription factor TFIIIC triple barrel domain-containing protein n=1 Tax=Wolfiporia cocos (strain MD-104) TaxID=742152 RepID=A0A2H3IXH7_WOLCO|nr:hypothetical protein WOLCODRAFT_139519 [Wolfiporia cocos MD-104 SS10]
MSATLVPGYQLVDAFGVDDDYEQHDGEVEEEVSYVTLDLGTVEPTLVPSSSSYRLIGLDSPTPFLQIAGTIFKGQHQRLLGTELLFTDSDDGQADHGKRLLHPVGITEQRIKFKEVELKEKGSQSPPDAQQVSSNKGKSTRDRIPETVDEVTGNVSAERYAPEVRSTGRGRGGRSAKGKSKGKGKEREDDAGDDEEAPVTTRSRKKNVKHATAPPGNEGVDDAGDQPEMSEDPRASGIGEGSADVSGVTTRDGRAPMGVDVSLVA